MKPLSIRLQIALVATLLPLTVVIVLSVLAYVEFEESLLGNIDETLRSMAKGMRFAYDPEKSHESLASEFRAITGQGSPIPTTSFRVWTDANEIPPIVAFPPNNMPPPVLFLPPLAHRPAVGESALFDVRDPSGFLGRRFYRALWMRNPDKQGVVNILLLHSSDYTYHELGEFFGGLLVVGGGIIVVTLLLVCPIVSWGLRSLTRAGARLEQITYTTLPHAHQVIGEVPVELKPFMSALDKMLERLHRSMQKQTQLTADVAHELRTPLAIVQSSLEALRVRPRTTAEYEAGIDDALQDVERLKRLVANILSLARLEAADEILHPTTVDLHGLLQSLTEMFNEQALRQGRCVRYTNPHSVIVHGDESELQQLFTNLLDNALRYGAPGRPVHVNVQRESDHRVMIFIHNEGKAISPDCLPRLFDRFYREDVSRSQASGGSGLGLAIAREIVQRHRGEIDITSDSQSGTTVLVRLPRQ